MSGRKRKADSVEEEVVSSTAPEQKADSTNEAVVSTLPVSDNESQQGSKNEEEEDGGMTLYDSGLIDEYYFIIKGVTTYDYSGLVESYVGQVLLEDGKSEIGRLEAFEVTRYLSSPNFYEWCDSIDQEVQECSTLFFDTKGRIQKKYVSKFPSAAKSDHPYVHITKICVDEAHRGKDLGIRLLKALLDQLDGTWSIAMMQPYPLYAGGAAFRLGIEKLTRYFARLGFKQVGTNASSSEIKFSALQLADYTGVILDKAAVQTLPVVLPVPEVVVSDVTKEIKKLIETTQIPDIRDQETLALLMTLGRPAFDPVAFEAKLREIQARGGDINAANALHYAAANNKYPLINSLIQCGKSLFLIC
jgi:GNAT superfamily N-acetyltransferase